MHKDQDAEDADIDESPPCWQPLSICSLTPILPSSVYEGLSVACALGTLDGLATCKVTEGVSLKWPNDLLIGRRKLGGIPLEAEEGFVVCGIGINLVAPEGIKATSDEPLGALEPACLEDALSGRPTPSFEVLANSVRTGIINRTKIWEHAMGDPAEPLAPMRKG
jgi:BirA family biotin operon repressor/biotin-[acetyl-CoA-carboxylase] ligase